MEEIHLRSLVELTRFGESKSGIVEESKEKQDYILK